MANHIDDATIEYVGILAKLELSGEEKEQAKKDMESMLVVLDLASQGMGVVFISSELEEVVRLSDDIEVLKDRHKIAEIENDDTVSQATIVETIANTNVNTGKEA